MSKSVSVSATRYLLWPMGAAVIALSLAQIPGSTATTHGGSAPVLLWLEVVAAGSLVLAGITAASTDRLPVALGVATTGLLWLSPEWAGLLGLSDGARMLSLAAGASVLPAAAATTLLVMAPSSHRGQVMAALAAGTGGLATLSLVTLSDPFFDARCWRLCVHNPFAAVSTAPASQWTERIGTALVVAAALAAFAICVESAYQRRRPLYALTVFLLLGGLATAAALRLQMAEGSRSTPYLVAFVAAQAGALSLAILVGSERWQAWRLRVALMHLVENLRLARSPASLIDALRAAVRDSDLQVAFWARSRGGWVAANGSPVPGPVALPGRTCTTVTRDGVAVAAIQHTTRIDAEHLDKALGPALRMSIENAQVQAATLAELVELRDSRIRLVQRTDAERRQLERNLHDGAQQRVVGLTLQLKMLRVAAEKTEHPDLIGSVRHAEQLAREMLTELRRIAHGIYPSMLLDAGLTDALLDLAESSTTVAVQVDDVQMPSKRLPDLVQVIAYLAVDAAIRDCTRRGACAATVSLSPRVDTGRLRLTVVDDGGPVGDHPALQLVDRVGALGGQLDVRANIGGGATLTLEVPCES